MPREHDLETSVERADPLVGTIFDKRFRVLERIAVGGFGAIYRAKHVKSGHEIALKVLLPSLARDLGVVARFRREGDTLTTLRNPHTITAYELGQAGDRTLFIVMELLHGESLFERYKAHGPLEWKRVVKIAHEVCDALDEAHALGIVHRDLKPTNIHLETKGDDPDFVKVLDFGIAKILGGGGFDAADLTNAGQMIGTIDYMSPEQMVGGTVTGQSDIYTLGIVMYEMIAGTTPFPESLTAAQALAAMMKTKPEPLYLRAPVPEELDRIVLRCLERETHRRYPTVHELQRDLDRLLEGVAHTRAQHLATKPVPTYDDGRRADWGTAESTTLVPPPAQLVAASRRSKRTSVDEATQVTPPPAALLAEARADDSGIEWTDDDEHAPTAAARRARREENERVTAVARLADIVERAAMMRAPASDRAATVPRPDARDRAMTVPRRPATRDSDEGRPTPPYEPATTAFPRPSPEPATTAFARPSSAVPPPIPPAPRKVPSAPPPIANVPSLPRTFTPSGPPAAAPPPALFVPTPLPIVSQNIESVFSTPIPFPVPPPEAPASAKRFDMARIAAREAMIRRLIWIVALVLAIGVGVILATQL